MLSVKVNSKVMNSVINTTKANLILHAKCSRYMDDGPMDGWTMMGGWTKNGHIFLIKKTINYFCFSRKYFIT